MVRSEVGDCDYQPEEEPPVERQKKAPVRNRRIRNTKTNAVRYVASNDRFRPENAHRIVKRKPGVTGVAAGPSWCFCFWGEDLIV